MAVEANLYFYHPTQSAGGASDMADLVHDRRSAIDSWIIPTYKALNTAGVEVAMGQAPPAAGIVIASSYSIPKVSWGKDVYLVSLLADGFVHARADFTIVQNLEQGPFCGDFAFMPHWPEGELIAREASRGSRVETMAYFGHLSNLDEAYKSKGFADDLERRFGVELRFPEFDSWHDYSEVDAVLAVRPSGGKVWAGCKPATKLYNAWRAGAPLVGGYQSAFMSAGFPGRDYLTTRNPEGVIDAVGRMKREAGLFDDLVQRGWQRAEDLTKEVISEQWVSLITDSIIPLAQSLELRGRRTDARSIIRSGLYKMKRRGTL